MMLVLSRRRGESIIVGDDIEIRVLEVHGSQVKIGIQAPTRHTVHRKEVYLAIQDKAKGSPVAHGHRPPGGRAPASHRPKYGGNRSNGDNGNGSPGSGGNGSPS